MKQNRIEFPNHIDSPRAYAVMRSGKRMHLFDASPLDIELEDFVFGASRVPRWGGQVVGEISYTSLQHSETVERIAVDMLGAGGNVLARGACLCHDLHEGGGIGDIITPYGRIFDRAGLELLKARLDSLLFPAAGLRWPLPTEVLEIVKKADKIAAVTEAVQLGGWEEDEARDIVGKGYRGPLWDKTIIVLDEIRSRESWKQKFRMIGGQGLKAA